MITRKLVSSLLLFDVETASEYKSLKELYNANPKKGELWSKRCEYLRKSPENVGKTEDELYFEKAPLHAEFAKAIAISFGRIKYNFNMDNTIDNIIHVENKSNDDEVQLLEETALFLKKQNFTLCGHNIKKFDIPFLFKRMLINNIGIPEPLKLVGKKPWEITHIDTAEVWSGGSWTEGFTSLDLLTNSLGIESPKDVISGPEVNYYYWNKNGLKTIAEYCGKDVVATCKVMIKLAELLNSESYNENNIEVKYY